MLGTLTPADSATAPAEQPVPDTLDDEFTLDVRVVLAAHPNPKLQCNTDDNCGDTCVNGASACDSYVDEPA